MMMSHALGQPYAGLDAGGRCSCGLSYDKDGSANEIFCNDECTGNSTQLCGSNIAMSVYQTFSGSKSSVIVT